MIVKLRTLHLFFMTCLFTRKNLMTILTNRSWHFLCKLGRVSLVGRVLDLRPEGPGSRLVADQRPPYTLRAPGTCKIRRGCNVLQVPCQYISGCPLTKWWPRHLSKDQNCETNCLRISLRVYSQTVGKIPLRSSCDIKHISSHYKSHLIFWPVHFK